MSSSPLPHRLVAFREKNGLSQEEMAGVLGVSRRYLSDLENGAKDIDTNTSLYKWFDAIEQGQVPLNRQLGKTNTRVREEPAEYIYTRRDGAGAAGSGLNPQDVLSQVRADLAMIEGGTQHEKRRAFHFLSEVHLPMLAKMMKLDT
jgi:transcriptional regulator with XRE-family HTH domain